MDTQSHPFPFPYQRLIVIGNTGSGKTTLSETLAQKLKLDFIELDALYWLPNWDHVSDAEFRMRVDQATRTPRWVVAGNYGTTRDISWPRAEAVIWLDYPLWTIFWRLWRRTWRRWWMKEILWGTNRERLWPQFKIWSAEDSLFHWLFKTYWRRKREYPQLFALPEFTHLKVFHMKTPQETEAWLKSLGKA
jgi:adenylate kinase family enzyme